MAEDLKKENVETVTSKLSEVEGLDGVMSFFKKYQNYFYIGLIALLLGVIAYTFLGKKSDPVKELKADGQMQYALSQMQRDSFDVALNGGENQPGLLSVINKNKGTKAADIARIEAGVCYLKTNRPKDALKMLEAADGFGKQVNARRLSLIGDAKSAIANETATVNNKMAQEAIESYEKAANSFPEDNISSFYLFNAAQLYEKMGKNDDAKKIYLKIKEKYPESTKIREVEKYLGKLGVEN